MLCTQIVFCFDIQNNLCTQHVLLMFRACSFHEQSFVMLWVSWCKNKYLWKRFTCTGKSLSKALLFAGYGENMLRIKIVLNVRNSFCSQHVLPRFELGIFMYWTCNLMNNLSSYCGLVDTKIRASGKDLPVSAWNNPCKDWFETNVPF